MPLAFDSKSHGKIAFGFFHIESNMLLLGNLFFFANRFTEMVIDLSMRTSQTPFKANVEGYEIFDSRDIGDLSGAISGIRYSGFIGALYSRYPFPIHPEGFKQKANGLFGESEVESIILHYGKKIKIPVAVSEIDNRISLGPFQFDSNGFVRLVLYVWEGGYPKWEKGNRPVYVSAMWDALKANKNPFLAGIGNELT
jgi:hypothetical protein